MPTQPLWNLGPPQTDVYSMLMGIGQGFSQNFNQGANREQRDREIALHKQRLDVELAKEQRELADQKTAGQTLADLANYYAQPGGAPAPMQPLSRSMPSFGKMQGQEPSADIKGVIQSAAAANNLSPEYLTRMASIESGFDPNARNPSGAAGLFQFVPGTWKQYGGNANPLDPQANAMAAGAFTKDNADALRKHLGRDPTQGELYLAHQQGAGGAAGLLANPDRPAAEIVGLKAVASNLPRGAGDPRSITAGQFASLWTGRFADLDASRAATPAQPAPGVPAPPPAPVIVAEDEDAVRRAEAGMMPGAADRPAPGATSTQFAVPPAPAGVPRPAGAVAGAPAAVPPPSAAAPEPAAILSTGLRAAAKSGMPPQELALVQRMAQSPTLRPMAVQILSKYANPQQTAFQRFTGRDGNEYAFNPDTAAVAPVAVMPQRGGRPMTADEKRSFGIPENTGAYIDEKGEPHTLAGTASTNVNLPKSETSYDTAMGADYAKNMQAVQAAGRNAGAVKNSLNLMERMVNDPRFYSGAGQEYVQGAKKALAAIGVNAEGNKPAEVFDALSKRLTLDVLGGSLGAGVSNTDVSFITSTSPSLTATKEGNLALIDMHRKIQDRQAQIAQMAREYVSDPSHPRLDVGFDQALAQYSAEHPIFPAPYQEQVAKLAGGGPAPDKGAFVKIQGDDDYAKLPSGATFIGPDGKKRRKP